MYKVLNYCVRESRPRETCINCEKREQVLSVECGWDHGVTPICRACLLESLQLAMQQVSEV